MFLELILFTLAVLFVTFIGTVSVNSAIVVLFSVLLSCGILLLTSTAFCQNILLFFLTFL